MPIAVPVGSDCGRATPAERSIDAEADEADVLAGGGEPSGPAGGGETGAGSASGGLPTDPPVAD